MEGLHRGGLEVTLNELNGVLREVRGPVTEQYVFNLLAQNGLLPALIAWPDVEYIAVGERGGGQGIQELTRHFVKDRTALSVEPPEPEDDFNSSRTREFSVPYVEVARGLARIIMEASAIGYVGFMVSYREKEVESTT